MMKAQGTEIREKIMLIKIARVRMNLNIYAKIKITIFFFTKYSGTI